MNVSWRTDVAEATYQEAIKNGHLSDGCTLCKINPPKKEFKHWKIQPNLFPYDKVSQKHDIIFTIRHVDGNNLNAEELDELDELKRTHLNENYQYLLEAMPKNKSIPGHFHLHLIVGK